MNRYSSQSLTSWIFPKTVLRSQTAPWVLRDLAIIFRRIKIETLGQAAWWFNGMASFAC